MQPYRISLIVDELTVPLNGLFSVPMVDAQVGFIYRL